ncbi:MAG: tRNA (adenosine(37)-N6)-dimethylallyltransferase MiaA [Cyclobacteriaceae bacterium]
MSSNRKCLIIVAGPTAVGKTSLSIKLAKRLNTEIISADSRQFFRELNIGTAKPSDDELAEVPHHMINNLSIHDEYNAGKFAEEVDELLEGLFETHDHVIMTGGSGMYIKAVCDGLDDMPDVPEDVRNRLNIKWEQGGSDELLERLSQLDKNYFELVDKKNKQRVVRALEVIEVTGLPYSDFRNAKKPVEKPYEVLKIGLEREREELYSMIDLRMDQMIEKGLFEEAEQFYPHKNLNALQTVGYREIYGYMNGEYDKDEAIRLLKRNSRRYAKRQMTWFKRDDSFRWFMAPKLEDLIAYIESKKAS